MNYSTIQRATFLSRPNRFIAYCRLDDGETVRCHVKNTGRCRELLVENSAGNSTVLLAKADNPNRSTQYDLVAVYKGDKLINMDSQAPNRAVAEFLPILYPDLQKMQAEYRWGSSRFDFYVEHPTSKRLIEVKGVTLEEDGHTRFPDAPTLRGLRHVEELIEARKNGWEATLFFVVQMEDAIDFSPNDDTQPAFREALRLAKDAGVEIVAYRCKVTEDSMTIATPIPVLI